MVLNLSAFSQKVVVTSNMTVIQEKFIVYFVVAFIKEANFAEALIIYSSIGDYYEKTFSFNKRNSLLYDLLGRCRGE